MFSHANGDRDMHHFINTDSASIRAANPMHFKLRTNSPLTFLPALLQTLHQQLTTTPHCRGAHCWGILQGRGTGQAPSTRLQNFSLLGYVFKSEPVQQGLKKS